MLDAPASYLITLFITTTCIAMATLFFCCWGKRNSLDHDDAPAKSARKGSDRSSPTKSQPGENDDATEKDGSASATNGSTAVTKSVPAFVVDSEDLGDFSVVSRETEILRSYRKPPPPKNRARQSRAPRAFKGSTENLDIFTELTEEGGSSFMEASTGSRPASSDQTGASLLRPRTTGDSSDGGGPRREDVRSSMLADIEQTLAALHRKAEDTSDDVVCVQENANADSSRPHSRLADENDERSATPGKQSPLLKPRVSPKPSPKLSPKVSPKPSPKQRSLTPVAPIGAETKQETAEQDGGVKSTHKTDNRIAQAEPEGSATDTPASISRVEASTDNAPVVSTVITSDVQQSQEQAPPTEAQQQTLAPAQEEENTKTSLDADAKLTPTSTVTVAARPQSVDGDTAAREATDTINSDTSENVSSVSEKVENGTGETEKPSSDDAEEKTESEQDVTEYVEAAGSSLDQSESSDAIKDELQKKVIRQKSTEEHPGKGKISKIPVRGGSKPRSSPPRSEKTEETSN